MNRKSTSPSRVLFNALLFSSLMLYVVPPGRSMAQTRPPNFVVIFCDDLGYGDLGTFGHPTIRTPNLDRLATEGQKWTNFYSAAPLCTPSRAALLTGRLPVRNGMTSDKRGVLYPDSGGGLPESEITIAEILKTRGYATAAIGKWHLGHLPQYLPARNGFDYYFGIPYSNDMDWVGENLTADERRSRIMNPKIEYWNVPLMRNDQVIERPSEQSTITERYTAESIRFISANKNQPFFLYLAHTMPHMPLYRSKEFIDRSQRGIYGDVIEELDSSVGRVIQTLRELKLDRNTLLVFTSDNGPWHIFDEQGGSAGLLRGAKGGTYEGGMRVPTIFWGPGFVKSGVINDIGSTLDLLPTFCKMAGSSAPADRVIDGFDLTPVLRGLGRSPRQAIFYYRGTKLYAMRYGSFKAHFITRSEWGPDPEQAHVPPVLYNLDHDPSEKYDVANKHPQIIAEISKLAESHRKTVQPVENQLEKPLLTSERPPPR
jgi:arylsulfatase A